MSKVTEKLQGLRTNRVRFKKKPVNDVEKDAGINVFLNDVVVSNGETKSCDQRGKTLNMQVLM